jgi:hypothetical protein
MTKVKHGGDSSFRREFYNVGSRFGYGKKYQK